MDHTDICPYFSFLPFLKPQYILHVIKAVRLIHDPEGCPDRSTSEVIPAMGPVNNLQPFADSSEEHRMISYDVSGTDHLHADLFSRPLAHHPLSAIDSHLVKIPPDSVGNQLS